ncbi:MAG: WG repeat-containing protein [Bacteroidota bacterium]
MRTFSAFLAPLLLLLLAAAPVSKDGQGDERYIAARSGLILRNGPSLKAAKILTIPHGEKVVLNGKSGDELLVVESKSGYMVGVNYKGKSGYVFEGFLSDSPQNIKAYVPRYDFDSDRWGYALEGSDKFVIAPQYKMVNAFFEGRAAVVAMDETGQVDGNVKLSTRIIDRNNRVIKENDFLLYWWHHELEGQNYPADFSDGLVLVHGKNARFVNHGAEAEGGYGYMNKNGELAIPLKYAQAQDFSEGFALVNLPSGKIEEGNVWVGDEKKWHFIRTDGSPAFDQYWEFARSFNEGRARVSQNGMEGFIDTKGKLIYPYKASDAFDFSSGLAWVKEGDFYKAIDRNGKVVLDDELIEVLPFDGDYAYVVREKPNTRGSDSPPKENGCWKIDKKGNYLEKVDCMMIMGGC